MSKHSTKQVRIKMNNHGRGDVFINAMRVRGVKSIRFSAGVDCVNQVELVVAATNVEIEGVMVCDISDIESAAREFLRIVVPQNDETLTAAAARQFGEDSAEAKYWTEMEAQAERFSAEHATEQKG